MLIFLKLAEGQSPEYLYIGCSDSRNRRRIMGMKPGEVLCIEILPT